LVEFGCNENRGILPIAREEVKAQEETKEEVATRIGEYYQLQVTREED
jgi:hypothetical protein